MRGCGWWVANCRKLGRALHSSYSSLLPPLLGPNLPEVWSIPHPITSRPQSSANLKTARVIDGKSIARSIRLGISSEISRMREATGKSPGLAIVLVRNRKDSQTFIRVKLKACSDVGIATFVEELPEECTEDRLLRVVSRLNGDPSVHGIIVQLPLPQHLNEERIVDVISPEKDVDGFHPLNMGNLALKGREPLFIPCAPKGCVELLLRSGVEIIGKKAVVIGRTKIVGLPTSLLLQRHHATVSMIHAFTKDPEEFTREADIVVADIGIPNIVRGSWLKPGAVVVDMGTNQVKVQPPFTRMHIFSLFSRCSGHLLTVESRLIRDSSGFRITCDVCYEEAIEVASAVTPVPGGAGPLTITMLMSNTLDSAKRASS